jgi:predicted nucleic acid-binding protein
MGPRVCRGKTGRSVWILREGKVERANDLTGLVATILSQFGERVLPVDTDTARHVARLGEHTHRQPVARADLIIAATAVRHGLVLLRTI